MFLTAVAYPLNHTAVIRPPMMLFRLTMFTSQPFRLAAPTLRVSVCPTFATMAPKVIRTAVKAKAKSKATAKAKAAMVQAATWDTFEIQAVYVSKVHKTPATFLILEMRTVNKFDMELAMTEQFTPVQETGMASYPIAVLTVRFPRNAVARRELEDSDANGIIVECHINELRRMDHDIVVGLCGVCGYPLF